MKKLTATLISLGLLLPVTLSAKQPTKGYRGFVEWSNEYRTEHFEGYLKREGMFYTGVTTVHGYQINPMFFVGAGIGMNRCGKLDNWIAPIFVDGRADFKFGRFTPFGDLRLGYNMAQGGGVYFSPTVGYRIGLGGKVGLNLGLGLSLAGRKVEVYDINVSEGEDGLAYEIKYVRTDHPIQPYLTFRVGIDF